MMRDAIDFHAVDEKHLLIHDRLENWALWCRRFGSADASPMFRLYQSPARARYASNAEPSADPQDAARIAKAVQALPGCHRAAINWCYVKPVNPLRACREIGTSVEGLALLVHQGRQMLLNRGA